MASPCRALPDAVKTSLVEQGTLYEEKGFPERAFACYAQAAKDVPEGMYRLGRCYSRGIGVAKDPRSAWDRYRRAANMGSIEAMLALGEIYEGDIGRSCDFFYQASSKGSRLGMKRLYEVLYSLPGAAPTRESFNWMVKAVEVIKAGEDKVMRLGFQWLCGRIATLYLNKDIIAKDRQMMMHYLERAIDLGVIPTDGAGYREKYSKMQDWVKKIDGIAEQ